jgi:hypothetical protein
MVRVIVTDEFHTVWDRECDSTEEVLQIVQHWLDSQDVTPAYEISIQIC